MATAGNTTPVRLSIRVPGHPVASIERVWGYPLGRSLYQLTSVPMLAYGIHHGDLVQAPSTPGSPYPVVARVYRAGGRRTARLTFDAYAGDAHLQSRVLARRRAFGASCTDGCGGFWAVDLPSAPALARVRRRLERYARREWLSYEIADTIVPGSFGPSLADRGRNT